MRITLEKRFSDTQLASILEQALIYACACPAQVCTALSQQRELFNYQASCLDRTDTDVLVHNQIAESIQRTHAEMEHCLSRILELEGWDKETLQMPAAMAKRLLNDIENNS